MKLQGTHEPNDEGTAAHPSAILGVRFDNIPLTAALQRVREFAAKSDPHGSMHKVVFTNVHSIHIAHRYREFGLVIDRADLVLPDGSGLKIAGKISGNAILENLNGTDFTPKVLAMAQNEGLSVYLLGARQDVVAACHKSLTARYPDLKLVGFHHGYFSPDEERGIIDEINAQQPNILLVALGSPDQEFWISRHDKDLRVGVALAVGGLFDFLSGERLRAPLWFRRLGIEWLFRFLHDPWGKWKRVTIEIPAFLFLVLADRYLPRELRSVLPFKGLKA